MQRALPVAMARIFILCSSKARLLSKMFGAMIWGVSIPWNLVVTAALGIWLMFAPAVFGTTDRAADSDHLFGAIITTISVITMAEVIRAGRFVNLLFGAALVAAPWLFNGGSAVARWNDVIAGLVSGYGHPGSILPEPVSKHHPAPVRTARLPEG